MSERYESYRSPRLCNRPLRTIAGLRSWASNVLETVVVMHDQGPKSGSGSGVFFFFVDSVLRVTAFCIPASFRLATVVQYQTNCYSRLHLEGCLQTSRRDYRRLYRCLF